MSDAPLTTIQDIHEVSRRNPGRWVSRGKGYEAFTDNDGRFRLTHYGQVIFTYDPSTGRHRSSGNAADRNAVATMEAIYRVGKAAPKTKSACTRPKTKPKSKPATPSKQRKTANAKPSTSAARLLELGYDLTDEKVVGKDPEMGYVESVVIGRRRSDGRYAVWYGVDWTKHPKASDRANGFTITQGAYDLTLAEARAESARRLERSSQYRWQSASRKGGAKPAPARNGKPGYNSEPRPAPEQYASAPYAMRSSGGHTILRVYYDGWESRMRDRPVYDVVATRQDIGGLIWGRDYDPMSGLWSGGDYDQTEAQIEDHAWGHRLIASYGKAGSPCIKGKAKPKASKASSKPRQSSQCVKRKPASSKPKAQSSKCLRKKTSTTSKPKSTAKRAASPQRKTTQSRNTKGQPARRRASPTVKARGPGGRR